MRGRIALWRPIWKGVPVAQQGPVNKRIHRRVEGTAMLQGFTRSSLVASLTLGSLLAYLAATAQPQGPPPAPTSPQVPRPVSRVPKTPNAVTRARVMGDPRRLRGLLSDRRIRQPVVCAAAP
jgi:hypothetical protein